MRTIARMFVSLFIMSALFGGCSPKGGSPRKEAEDINTGIKAIVRRASENVEKVEHSFIGEKDTPIFVLEELHTSRKGQIQHAITLVRLYEKYNLRHIGLEGFCVEESSLNTQWYLDAAGNDAIAATGVAIRFLKEGEINCAEFMKLVYDDISVLPIETEKQHKLKPSDKMGDSINAYVQAILKASPESQDWVAQRIEEINTAVNPKDMRICDFRAVLVRIKDYADKKNARVSDEDEEVMQQSIAFWSSRHDASITIVDKVASLVNMEDIKSLAIIIGKAHTYDIRRMLRDAEHSHFVLTPLCIVQDDKNGDLPWGVFERKMEKQSLYSEGYKKLIHSAFSSGSKPSPVLNEPWFQGEAELSLFIDRIARKVLGSGAAASGSSPPYGFNESEFIGKWVEISPRDISVVPDEPHKAVVFPVSLKDRTGNEKHKIYVKAGLNSQKMKEKMRSVEELLMEALRELDRENDIAKKAESQSGVAKITMHTNAAFAISKDRLSSISTSS